MRRRFNKHVGLFHSRFSTSTDDQIVYVCNNDNYVEKIFYFLMYIIMFFYVFILYISEFLM